MSVPATKSAQQLEHKKAEDLAVELAKKSRQQDYEYQEMLEKMKTEFFAIYDKTKEDKEKEVVEEHIHLGDFEKLRTLGSGSFGVVILVKNTISNEFFAMKAMDKQRIVKLKQLEHSLNEKKILEAIRFPFLVNMEFFFKDNSFIYMIMPFVNGGEMFTHLRRLKRFDEQLAKFYAAQVVLGLEYLHNLDIVYRDLKPENILLDAKGYLKIGDMGFCKIVKGRAWTLCGTPEYIAPEIILSRGYGKSVDWWSFGILIYEMNAGLPPFVSCDPMILYEKIVAGKFRFYAHFTSELKDLIKNILQVDLSRRYGNLKNGVYDIKSHRWFRDTSWVNIYNRKVAPIYKPIVRTTGDATNFDNIIEEPLIVSAEDRYEQEFQDF